MKKNVCLLVIATGKYTQFLEQLLDSAHRHFLKDHDVDFRIFTDRSNEARASLLNKPYHCTYHHVDHGPWPFATLYRFDFFSHYKASLQGYNYYFYVDVDSEFKADVGDEVLSDRTGTMHCGFMKHRGTYETNKCSRAFVAPHEGERYYAGGFWGFSHNEFWKFVGWAKNAVDDDQIRNITPEHNDEAYLNRYFIDNPPTKNLTPAYHYPESHLDYYKNRWPEEYPCIILLLDKNHEEVRS